MSKPTYPELPPRPSRPEASRTLYFAFGSNLHLKQMATRCPNSIYIGRAILRHFRWQINQRGYANVVPDHGYWVEGLVFEIDSEDERRLDKSEGVAKTCVMDGQNGSQIVAPCYRKEYRSVFLYPACKALYRRTVPYIVEKGGAMRLQKDDLKEGGTTREFRGRRMENVLVYASPDFVRNGVPKEEYVRRINSGIRDARILGVTSEYIDMFVRACVPPDGQATAHTHVYPLMSEPGEGGLDRRIRNSSTRRESTSYEEVTIQQRVRDRARSDDERQGTSRDRPLTRSLSLRGGHQRRRRAHSMEGRGLGSIASNILRYCQT